MTWKFERQQWPVPERVPVAEGDWLEANGELHGFPLILTGDWILVYPVHVASRFVATVLQENGVIEGVWKFSSPDGLSPYHPPLRAVPTEGCRVMALTRQPSSWLVSMWKHIHRGWRPEKMGLEDILPRTPSRPLSYFFEAYLDKAPGGAAAYLLSFTEGADYVINQESAAHDLRACGGLLRACGLTVDNRPIWPGRDLPGDASLDLMRRVWEAEGEC